MGRWCKDHDIEIWRWIKVCAWRNTRTHARGRARAHTERERESTCFIFSYWPCHICTIIYMNVFTYIGFRMCRCTIHTQKQCKQPKWLGPKPSLLVFHRSVVFSWHRVHERHNVWLNNTHLLVCILMKIIIDQDAYN